MSARHLGRGDWLALVVALRTVALGAISFWIAFTPLINAVAGRRIFAFPGPVFHTWPRQGGAG